MSEAHTPSAAVPPSSEGASQQRDFKYAPRLAEGLAGDPLAVNVDLPDNAGPEEFIAAIHEAAALLGLDTGEAPAGESMDLPDRLL